MPVIRYVSPVRSLFAAGSQMSSSISTSSTCASRLTWRWPMKTPFVTQLISPYESSSEWRRYGLLAAVTARFSRPSAYWVIEAIA